MAGQYRPPRSTIKDIHFSLWDIPLTRFGLIFAFALLLPLSVRADSPATDDSLVTGDPASDPPGTVSVSGVSPDPIASGVESSSDTRNAPIDKRVFGVLPNYRTANQSDPFTPLTVKQKFHIGLKDSTDYPVFPIAAGFAGLAQIMDQHHAFGQGMEGYAKRFGAALADQDIGNMLTESVMPSLLHQDPRYFRKGYGSVWSRAGYAATRIFVNPNDKGKMQINYSELIGNAAMAGIGNLYYPGERRLGDNLERYYTALITDSFSQVLKEFWPDIKRKYFHKHAKQD